MTSLLILILIKSFKPIFKSRKLNISLVFIIQSYFFVPKEVRLNSTHYLIIKIHNKTDSKYGDKYDKKLMDTDTKIRNRWCKNCF